MKKGTITVVVFIITVLLSIVDLCLSLAFFSDNPTYEDNPVAKFILVHAEHPFLITTTLKTLSMTIYGWIVLKFKNRWSGLIASLIGLLIYLITTIIWILFPFSILG
jgi:hypothetical protein